MGEDGHVIAPAPPADDLLLRGLVLLAQFHGIAADAHQLSHDYGRTGEGFDEPALLLAACCQTAGPEITLQRAASRAHCEDQSSGIGAWR